MIANKVEEKKPISVGDEFIEWAEKFWALENTYSEKDTKDKNEALSYKAMKGAWVSKINSIISKRICEI